MLNKFRRDTKGATIIEYALIASLIAVVAIAAMNKIGGAVKSKMNAVATELNAHQNS